MMLNVEEINMNRAILGAMKTPKQLIIELEEKGLSKPQIASIINCDRSRINRLMANVASNLRHETYECLKALHTLVVIQCTQKLPTSIVVETLAEGCIGQLILEYKDNE